MDNLISSQYNLVSNAVFNRQQIELSKNRCNNIIFSGMQEHDRWLLFIDCVYILYDVRCLMGSQHSSRIFGVMYSLRLVFVTILAAVLWIF